MAWTRLILLVVVLAALVVLTIQNLSPSLSLVFLGGQTQALPLAFWLLCAIAVGSLTAILIRLLTSSRSATRKGWRQRPAGFSVPPDPTQSDYRQDRETYRQSSEANYGFSASTAPRSDPAYDAGYRSNYSDYSDYRANAEPDYADRASDSWNQSTRSNVDRSNTGNPVNQAGRKLSDWMANWGQFSRRQYMDWDERDRGLEEWEDWDGYDDLNRPPRPRDEFDELEDLERDRNSAYTSQPPPPRDYEPRDYEPRNYEASQEAEETYRSGSVYSYSYRRSGDEGGHVDNIYDRSDEPEPDSADPAAVYDADYRVITPPQYPDDEALDNYGEEYRGDYDNRGDVNEPDYVDDYRNSSEPAPQWREEVPPNPIDPNRNADDQRPANPQPNTSNQDDESWEDWDSFIERKQQDDGRW